MYYLLDLRRRRVILSAERLEVVEQSVRGATGVEQTDRALLQLGGTIVQDVEEVAVAA